MTSKSIFYILIGAALVTLLATTLPADSPQNDEGIQFFDGSFSEALAKAKKENKLVFMDVYATWCGPCKALKQRTFPVKEVGDFYNANFINVAMDGEKGEGPDILKRYGIRGYPTLLFIDGQGEVVHKTMGFRTAEKFIEIGEEVMQMD